jgi:hypothetical protein
MISFHFEKSTEITGYPIGIKVRHEMKPMEFQMNSIINSVTAKQVIVRIINEFIDSSPQMMGAKRAFTFFLAIYI